MAFSCGKGYEEIKMQEPLFSIVIPVYKVEKYLEECLNSVLHQDFTDYEVIMVDDGSPDRCPEICDRYAAEYPAFHVFHKANGGCLSSRDYGIRKATGKYIVNLDSDDTLKKDALKTISDKICKYKNPDCVIFSFEHLLKDGVIEKMNCGTVDKDILITDKNTIFKTLLEHATYNIIWRKVVKRELLLQSNLSGYYHISNGEDLVITLFVYRYAASFLLVPDVLYRYRANPLGLTESVKRAKAKVSFEKEELAVSFFRKYGNFSEEDIEEYRTFLRNWLFVNLVEAATARTGYKNTIKWFELYRNDRFYESFISSKCSTFPFGGQRFKALTLLENRRYGRLFFYCIFAKIRSIISGRPIDDF